MLPPPPKNYKISSAFSYNFKLALTARITVGRDPGTGKQIQRSITGKTQKEVREKMQAAAVSLNEGDYFEPSKMALARWIEIWLDEYTGDKKYLTVKH